MSSSGADLRSSLFARRELGLPYPFFFGKLSGRYALNIVLRKTADRNTLLVGDEVRVQKGDPALHRLCLSAGRFRFGRPDEASALEFVQDESRVLLGAADDRFDL